MSLKDDVLRLLFTVNDKGFILMSAAVFFVDAIITFLIIQRVPYTEIDWSTYMQQVECFTIKNIRNYSEIEGDTGPVVYPAGHLWTYSVFHALTNAGKNIRAAQYIFMGLYLLNLLAALRLYYKSNKVYVGLPFLIHDPISYIRRSFDLGRVFLFKWTVNWRFLPEEIFLSPRLHLALLSFHLVVLMMERTGGVGLHVSPFIKPQDIGSLLNKAGFDLVTLDSDEIQVGYPNMMALMYDLQLMAESHCTFTRSRTIRKDVLLAADAIYKAMYEKDDRYPATFRVISFIGWKPGPNMPKPAKRGSQNVSFKDLGKIVEDPRLLEKLSKKEDDSEKK
ncbi:ALG3 protein [Teladorsagia circumcincta]|uniref:dolichyl-P-Man:Man5GlcNAc2-PP-dolichol alpha-1,3-mannosyltransferase n=1 Tax=Teladorsagia circumcincta TaxID=45464 RepID=A0A2G9UXU7_TELCI|nr:ALG3 protein [Teladorsagia circumcincta]